MPVRQKSGKILHIPLKSKNAALFMKQVIPQMMEQWGGKPPIDSMVKATFLIFGTWSTNEVMPDLSNLYQAPEDALQAAGVLADDRLIDSHDGSRRVPMCDVCPDVPIIQRGPRKGARRDTCGKKKTCPYMGYRIILKAMSRDDIEPLAKGRCGQAVTL